MIADAYIGYREGSMTIEKGDVVKNIVLYPLANPSLPIVKLCKQPQAYLEEIIHSPLTVPKALEFRYHIEDDVINNFINQPANVSNVKCQMLKEILDNEAMEDPLKDINQHIQMTSVHNHKPIEVKVDKILNINVGMDRDQQQKLIHVLQKYKGVLHGIILI